MDENQKNQVIDLNDVREDQYNAWKKSVDDWRNTGEPFRISPVKIILEREADAFSKGCTNGLILGGVVCIIGGITGYILDKLSRKLNKK